MITAPVTFAVALYVGVILAAAMVTTFSLWQIGILTASEFDKAIARIIKVGLVVWLVSVAITLPYGIRNAQAEALQLNCKGQMKTWAVSLHNYLAENGHFPPTTKTVDENRHSWRVLVAPYAVAPELRDQYNLNAAWNSDDNFALEDTVERYFHCPDHTLSDDMTKTSFVAVIGPNCVLRDDSYPPRRFEDLNPDAVLFVETTRTDIHWMAPKDLSYARLIADRDYAESVLGGPHPNGGCFVTVDGRVETIASIGIDELLRRCVVETTAVTD